MPNNKYQEKHKDCKFKVKAADEGMIEGLASTFGNRDLDDESFRFGAFTKTLQETGGKIPILDSHNRTEPIGWNLEARETQRGLEVRGELDIENNARAKSKFSFVRKALEIGANAGLSIGFRPIKIEDDRDNDLIIFTEVALKEYSVVTFAANPQAMVTGAKNENVLPFLDLPIKQYGYSKDADSIKEASEKQHSPQDFIAGCYVQANTEIDEYKYQIAGVDSNGNLVAVSDLIKQSAKQAQEDNAPHEVLKHIEKYLKKLGEPIPWQESETIQLIKTYKEAISLHERLLDSGHEFSQEEILAFAEISESCSTLLEPSKNELKDTLRAVQELTKKIQSAAA